MICSVFLLLAMTMLGSVASLFLKKASAAGGMMEMMKRSALYAGAFLYVISAVLNILLLRRLDYSVVLPLTSLTYVWTMILSSVLLRETITKKQIMGVFLILVGAVLIGVS